MRIVRDLAELPARGRQAARREAAVGVRRRHRLRRAATSSSGRHVEVQVLGDAHGTVLGRSASATARSSAATRRSSRRRPSPLRRRDAAQRDAARRGRARPPRRSATSAPARSSSCSTPSRRLLLPRDEHPAPGRAPGHRAASPASTWSSCSCASPRARRARPREPPRVARARDRGPALRRGPGRGLAAADRAAAPLRGARRHDASSGCSTASGCGSTPASWTAPRCRRTTTRCWPR